MQTSVSVAAGDTIRRGDHEKVVVDIAQLYRFWQGPTSANHEFGLKARLHMAASAETVGSFTSDGKLLMYGLHEQREAEAAAVTETVPAGTTTSTSVVLVYNKALLLPASGATTIKKLVARLSVGIASVVAADGYLDSVDVIVSKVASGGTETTLATVSKASIAAQNTGGTTYGSAATSTKIVAVSSDFGAGYSLGATDRLCIRVKLYGKTFASGNCGLALNATAGAYNSPTSNLSAESWVALTFG